MKNNEQKGHVYYYCTVFSCFERSEMSMAKMMWSSHMAHGLKNNELDSERKCQGINILLKMPFMNNPSSGFEGPARMVHMET